MAQTAFFHETFEARLITGKVVRVENRRFRVLADGTVRDASLAASCLLEPRENDVVLLAGLENGADVILSILFRDESAEALVRLPDNSAVECRGALTLRGESSLGLQSGEALRLESRDLNISSRNATANVVKVNTVIDTAELCCRALTSLGQTAVSVFRSVTQCLGESRRMVEGSDATRCGNSTFAAEAHATVMSINSLQLTEETARTDAKLIQLG